MSETKYATSTEVSVVYCICIGAIFLTTFLTIDRYDKHVEELTLRIHHLERAQRLLGQAGWKRFGPHRLERLEPVLASRCIQ